MPTLTFAELKINYSLDGSGDTLIIFPDNILASGAYKKEIDFFSQDFQVSVFLGILTGDLVGAVCAAVFYHQDFTVVFTLMAERKHLLQSFRQALFLVIGWYYDGKSYV